VILSVSDPEGRGVTGMKVGTVAALWRYPVKSMGGEMVATSVADRRALHGDRMWAVRDLELDAVTTARRLLSAPLAIRLRGA